MTAGTYLPSNLSASMFCVDQISMSGNLNQNRAADKDITEDSYYRLNYYNLVCDGVEEGEGKDA